MYVYNTRGPLFTYTEQWNYKITEFLIAFEYYTIIAFIRDEH